jgi:hypothetical protein
MSDPNNVLSAWQLTVMITVPVMLLFGWVIAVFIAARMPRVRDVAAAAPPAKIAAFPVETGGPGQPEVPAPLAA